MACGKSSVGRKLAKALGMPFLDLDKAMTQKADMSIPEIFELHGADFFRKIEQEALHETFTLPPTIIATGGGAPCFFDNMEQMNQQGVTYYLEVNLDILASRLFAGRAKRPLVNHFTEREALKAFIEQKLKFFKQRGV